MSRTAAVDLSGATALVTGASGGIGEAFARALADRGAHLVLVARRTAALEALAEQLRGRHPALSVVVAAADLSEAGAAGRVVRAAADAGAVVDVLVNNAGVGSHGPFADHGAAAAARMVQLNCTSLVELTGLLLPGMLERGRGAVVSVASTAAFQPTPSMAVYGATKAFVLSFTEALWVETRRSGVRVLAVCPGPTETGFFEAASPGAPFLVRGRQRPERVVDVALAALTAGDRPSVVSGAVNRATAAAHRVLPRAVAARVSGRYLRGPGERPGAARRAGSTGTS